MRIGRSNSPAKKTEVVVLTADAGARGQARSTFGASEQIELRVVTGSLAAIDDGFELDGATVAVVDLDAGQQAEMQALERLMARVGALAASRGRHAVVRRDRRARWCRCASPTLVKPVSPVELVRTCARVAKGRPPPRTPPSPRSIRSCRRSAARA